MKISPAALARLLTGWRSGSGPAHKRLTEFVRMLILDGRLPLGAQLPGEREVAAVLGVSRTTVATAFAGLRQLGYLETSERSRSLTRIPRPADATITDGAIDGLVDLSRAAVPAPGERLFRAYGAAQEQLPRHLHGYGYSSPGIPELREAIAARFTARGVATVPDQILVTNGALHALALLANLLLRPRNRVVVDHPSYPHALELFRSRGARLIPVALTAHGWDLQTLQAACGQADLLYLQPDFHNPTGLLLSDEDRERFRPACTVVVDETMSELALDQRLATPFAAHHPRAITIGSASKTLWGGLRIGWIRADAALISRLARSRSIIDLGTPIIEQLVCAELLTDADQLIADRVPTLRAQKGQLLESLDRHLPDWLPARSNGGLSVWIRLPSARSSALAAIAPRFGIQVSAGPRFGVGGAFERFLRLPYSLPVADIDPAMARLREAWAALGAGETGEGEDAPLV